MNNSAVFLPLGEEKEKEDEKTKQKVKVKEWNIMRYNFDTQEKTRVAKTIDGEEDFCWTPYETILMGSKGKLYMLEPKLEDKAEWKEVADYSKTVGDFYRLACSPMGNKLVLVSYRGAKP